MQARRSHAHSGGRRRRVPRGLLGLLLGAGLTLTAPDRALAIPEADAIKKLEVIPVFVLADDKGVPLPIPREKALLLPLYLERAKADQELANLRKSSPNVKAQVLAIPLNVMNERVAELNKQLKDKTKPLVAPVVVNPRDRQQAVAMLKQQGLSDKQIEEGLSVPVFFAKPFLTINTPKGPRGVFFLSYDEMQQALAKLPDKDKLKPQVADLTAVLREIIKAPEDSYVIFPTQEYFRLVRDNQGKGGPAAAPAPGR
ncbi:hypothetical protein KBY76_11785 [Synechococcus sp. GreenBA-s]|jgi:hypothetical protein|nr:hypothetical protein [Synechococcus sp. GreenBA-s]